MSNSFKIDLNSLRQEGLKEIFSILENAFEQAGIDFYYIIGALARDIWFAKEGINSRATKDIDFAALVAGKEQFEKVKDILKNKFSFTESRGNAFALITPEGRTIDILPFGEIEVNEGVAVVGMGLRAIKVNGFKEVGPRGVEQVEMENTKYHIARLPSIVLLKLIAYDDRPEHRQNDPGDIAQIIYHYFTIETDIFYDEHYDLLERIDEGQYIMAARVIGRQLREVLAINPELKERILTILKDHIAQATKNLFVQRMTKTVNGTIETSTSLLQEILEGIQD